ncbi:hypothetical protein D3C75_174690 [compost metagenome]
MDVEDVLILALRRYPAHLQDSGLRVSPAVREDERFFHPGMVVDVIVISLAGEVQLFRLLLIPRIREREMLDAEPQLPAPLGSRDLYPFPGARGKPIHGGLVVAERRRQPDPSWRAPRHPVDPA